jgi:hypothetical protein
MVWLEVLTKYCSALAEVGKVVPTISPFNTAHPKKPF